MESGTVVSIPGAGAPWFLLGGRDAAVGARDPPVQAATPSTLLAHPENAAIASRPATLSAAQTVDGLSVTRKGKSQFLFHVLIWPTREVDGHLRDSAAGEREGRLIAAGHR